MSPAAHCLTIVVPALDEQQAIGDTIERCLAARPTIMERAGLSDVEIVVVSDGSSDDTERIARSYEDVTVLAFERNRGYGAAIKCGFAHGHGDLVGFLDADGTCDPLFFADLCCAIEEQPADVAIGGRMGPDSEMPWVRTVGNGVFAWMLGLLSKRVVGDTASGMRVIRRSVLPELYPLPDGLHFTPAMSAAVLIGGHLRLVELPMAYSERVGRSKLSVVRDGIRFFSTILQAAMCFRPARPLLLVAAVFAVVGFLLGIGPSLLWLRRGFIEEWMIYRLLLASMLATAVALLVCGAVVAERIVALSGRRDVASSGVTGAIARLFSRRGRLIAGGLMTAAAVVVAWPGIVQYLRTGTVDIHWSRAVLAALLLVLTMVLGITSFLLNMMALIDLRLREPGDVAPPDRVRPARNASA